MITIVLFLIVFGSIFAALLWISEHSIDAALMLAFMCGVGTAMMVGN